MTTERNWLSCCGALALGEACGFCAERFAALEPVVLGSLLLCSLFGFGLKLRGWTLLAVFLSGLALAFGAVLAREAVLNEVLRRSGAFAGRWSRRRIRPGADAWRDLGLYGLAGPKASAPWSGTCPVGPWSRHLGRPPRASFGPLGLLGRPASRPVTAGRSRARARSPVGGDESGDAVGRAA